MSMRITANHFSVIVENSWCGTSFKVEDDKGIIIIKTASRAEASAACAYLNNGVPYIDIKDDGARLNQDSYFSFNQLMMKYKLGKPLPRKILESKSTSIGLDITINWTIGKLQVNEDYFDFTELPSLDDLLKKITALRNMYHDNK